MHIYFCGIGGAGLAPLAELSLDCGFKVSGSDRENGLSISELQQRGIDVSFDQTGSNLQQIHNRNNIDLFVHSSAIKPDHAEFVKAVELGIKTTKRDGLLNRIVKEKNLKLLAIAGTHGKTTTTAMVVWLFQQLNIPISYSIGSNISFGPAAKYEKGSEFFAYECDEFDRNFLHFNPYSAIITSLDYDHPDTYLTENDYFQAFAEFTKQCKKSSYIYSKDGGKLSESGSNLSFVDENIPNQMKLPGVHNRQNAWLAITLIASALNKNSIDLIPLINTFPGTQRRLELLAKNVYSDYAHHPSEIRATLQSLKEIAQHGQKIVAVYQPHQNVRQHLIQHEYGNCFVDADKVFWLPTYLSREDETLEILTPTQLLSNLIHSNKHEANMDVNLEHSIEQELKNGSIIVFMGAGSVDGWAREIWGK